MVMNIETKILSDHIVKRGTNEKFQIMGVYVVNGLVNFLLLNERNEFFESRATNFDYIVDQPNNPKVTTKTLLTETK